MSRIEQVAVEELEMRQKATVRHGANQAGTRKRFKLFEYIIPLFSKGGRIWRWKR